MPGTGSVTLRTLFPNPQQLLLPGMFVRAMLEEGVKEQAILVPQRGVTRNPAGKAMVMVVGADEKVEPRVIKVDRTVGDNWLVSDGLESRRPGDPGRAAESAAGHAGQGGAVRQHRPPAAAPARRSGKK